MGAGAEVTPTQPVSDPCRLYSSVPLKGKSSHRGQKLHVSHDMVCAEESASLCYNVPESKGSLSMNVVNV